MTESPTPLRTLAVITTTCFPDPRVRAIRWTQLARTLPAFGWRVVLLSRYYGSAASREEIDAALHPTAAIEYVDHPAAAQPEPGQRRGAVARVSQARRLLATAASLRYVPDPSVRAWQRMKPRILETLGRHTPDAVLAGFPTGGNISLVPWLADAQPAPVLADFEDPFTIDDRFGPRGIRALRAGAFRVLEREVHRRASLVLHAIPMHHRWARLAYPDARDRFRLLMMSVPEALAEGKIEPIIDPEQWPAVRVVGAMGGPEMLNLARAVDRLSTGIGPVRLDLVGSPPDSTDEIIALLGDRVRIHGRVAHSRALGFIAGASVLVNSLDARRRHVLGLSSKLFEFAASGNPVIEINPTRSDRHFVRTLPGVRMLSEPTVNELSAAIGDAIAGRSEDRSATMRRAVRQHAWPARARQLAGWLDDVVQGGAIRA